VSIFSSPVVDTIVLITAIINIVSLLVLFFTCRLIPSLHMANTLKEKGWYKSLYKYHSYLWWLLVPSASVHAIIAIIHRLVGG